MKRRLLDSKSIAVRRTDIRLSPDQNRVLLRPLRFGTDAEFVRILHRALALPESEVRRTLDRVLEEFSSRHRRLNDRFLTRFRQLEHFLPAGSGLTEARKLLIGSYFLFEYSIESAGLFNPSILGHPDQSNMPDGQLRFLLSLRSTGEGHISSISFRTGVLDTRRHIVVDSVSRFLAEP